MSKEEEIHIAAVDLGSNSFHMIVARYQDGNLQVIDRIREMVKLSAGLDSKGTLEPEAYLRALNCLRVFGQRIKELPHDCVRAVGTKALRTASNSEDFLADADLALGHRIEIISGMEEARLIYQGVANDLGIHEGRRLVFDIGGGSTEIIVGQGYDPLFRESLSMGCVSFTERFFPQGEISKERFAMAVLAARMELEPVRNLFRRIGWQQAIGTSGTIRTVQTIVEESGWDKHVVTTKSLAKVVDVILKSKHLSELPFEGMGEQRQAVFPGGVAILTALFESLNVDKIEVAEGALREGVLFDLIGRIEHHDVRELSVANLAGRYQVDLDQVARVEATAEYCRKQVAKQWQLSSSYLTSCLSWGAQLHELGLSIAHNQYHKHGGYIVRHSDMAGFSQQDQALLAILVQMHRKKISKTTLKTLPKKLRPYALHMLVLLRLSVVLHRGRVEDALPEFFLSIEDNKIKLTFPETWLDEHALTNADLEQEAKYLQAVGLQLEVV